MPPRKRSRLLPPAGLYQIWIELRQPLRRRIGCLGRLQFASGRYVYTGSAKRNLPARIARHRRRSKKLRWHIDHLLASRHAQIRQIRTRPWQPGGECRWHRQTARRHHAAAPVRRFGSSDCRCPAHLLFLGPQTH